MAISISREQIPDSALADLETLHSWTSSVLKFMSNYSTYQEAEGLTSFTHDSAVNTSYLKDTIVTYRSILKFKPDYASGAYPAEWQKIDPMLDGAIPAEYLA